MRLTSDKLFLPAMVAVISLACTAVSAQQDADGVRSWLDRMNSSVEQTNYRGTFVYDDDIDSNLQTIHIVHRYQDGAVSERVSSEIGGEVLRTEDSVRWTFPNQQLVVVEQPYQSAIPLASSLSYADDLERHYQLTTFPGGLVAERETQIVSIRARDEYRYGYLLWLDRETALPLKMQVRNELGEVVQSFLFTEIAIGVDIPEFIVEREPRGSFARLEPESDLPESPVAARWAATRLPKGFELSFSKQSHLGGSPFPVEHLVYTDGLATVSVFIARSNATAGMPEGFSHFGCANAYSIMIGDYLATAIGEVPRQTVQTIATSLDAL